MTKKQTTTTPVIDDVVDETVEAARTTGHMLKSIKYNARWVDVGKPVSADDFADGDFDMFVANKTIELDSH